MYETGGRLDVAVVYPLLFRHLDPAEPEANTPCASSIYVRTSAFPFYVKQFELVLLPTPQRSFLRMHPSTEPGLQTGDWVSQWIWWPHVGRRQLSTKGNLISDRGLESL